MEKKEFYEAVKEAVLVRLNEEDETIGANITNVTKNNGVEYTGLQFTGESNIQPVVYLDQFYSAYEDGVTDIDRIADHIYDTYHANALGSDFNLDDLLDYEKAKNNLMVVVRNAELNAAQLEKVPHEIHEDLAEMYRVCVSCVDDSMGSVLVTNEMLEKFGVDEATLKEDAWSSMRANHPGELKNMFDVLNEIYSDKFGEDMPADMMEMMGVDRPAMYVYTSKDKFNGSAYMFDKEAMNSIAEKFGESFAVLPSSIHEYICLPESVVESYDDLKRMVEEVNSTQVSVDEQLSDNVYRYDKDTQELSMYDGQSEDMSMNM